MKQERIPADQPQYSGAAQPFALPSLTTLKAILKRSADSGLVTWSSRFKARCKLRGFTAGYNTVDVVHIVRHGNVVSTPTYDGERRAWRIEIGGLIEGRGYFVEVLLDCLDDYTKCPRTIVITGCFRRKSRKEARDWSTENE
jgi:hypothetical protein